VGSVIGGGGVAGGALLRFLCYCHSRYLRRVIIARIQRYLKERVSRPNHLWIYSQFYAFYQRELNKHTFKSN